MKVLLAADGSEYTKKALAFLVTHESLVNSNDELIVLNVQPPVPGRVTSTMRRVTRYLIPLKSFWTSMH